MFMIQNLDMHGKILGYLPGEYETVHHAIQAILSRDPKITLARASVIYRIVKAS